MISFGRFWSNPGEDLYERSWWLFIRASVITGFMALLVITFFLVLRPWTALACVIPGALAALMFGAGSLIGLVAWRRADPRSAVFLLPVFLNGFGFAVLVPLVFAVARVHL